MSKMSELELVLQEFHAAAKALIGAADSLRGFYSRTAEPTIIDAPPPKAETKPEPPKPEPQTDITENDVRRVLAEKSRNGLTAQVKALLTKFKVEKVSQLKPEQYGAILAEAEEIK